MLIYCDNQGAINRAKNEVYHSRTKHIDVHYSFIIDYIKNNFIRLEYITTNEMVSDCITKALDRVKHHSFNNYMGLNDIESYVANISLCVLGSRGCVEESNQKHASERKASALYKRKLLKRKALLYITPNIVKRQKKSKVLFYRRIRYWDRDGTTFHLRRPIYK
ncbi:hypothetical protein O181_111690 [Austropuccinia psidii MF-1]|uniref:Retrovirus-related Pol polyprotein from transposon TNT 1-94 n=1 Tax=Austropuccinia psidii MF-1 TaxID=1389203 RepID=A0A9Q3K2X1_9BASI|nr:hypothetical protein [Austropuccinia psidii MF-1]